MVTVRSGHKRRDTGTETFWVDVSQFTCSNAPPQYLLIRYRVGSAAVFKAALFSTWSFENSDCGETQTPISEYQACRAANQRADDTERIVGLHWHAQ